MGQALKKLTPSGITSLSHIYVYIYSYYMLSIMHISILLYANKFDFDKT